jgi:hypothetical protein
LIFPNVREWYVDRCLARRFVRFDTYGTVDHDLVLGSLISKNAAYDGGEQENSESYDAETARFHCGTSFDVADGRSTLFAARMFLQQNSRGFTSDSSGLQYRR